MTGGVDLQHVLGCCARAYTTASCKPAVNQVADAVFKDQLAGTLADKQGAAASHHHHRAKKLPRPCSSPCPPRALGGCCILQVYQDTLAASNQVAEEVLSLSRVVRTFGTEGKEEGRYKGWLERLYSVGLRQATGYGERVTGIHCRDLLCSSCAAGIHRCCRSIAWCCRVLCLSGWGVAH
jgi:hypothetical protein